MQRALEISTSASLIQRVRDLDDGPWTVLAQLYGPLIYGWARRTGLQSQDASDVLQNVLVSVWRARASFQQDRPGASFRGWLWTITQNAIRELRRRRKSQLREADWLNDATLIDAGIQLDPDSTEGTGPTEFCELAYRALEIIRRVVDESTWNAFWKTAIEEIPVSEVAAQLQMSAAAVRQAKYRILCRLRNMLADQ